jgi:hypothetical protein
VGAQEQQEACSQNRHKLGLGPFLAASEQAAPPAKPQLAAAADLFQFWCLDRIASSAPVRVRECVTANKHDRDECVPAAGR